MRSKPISEIMEHVLLELDITIIEEILKMMTSSQITPNFELFSMSNDNNGRVLPILQIFMDIN